MWLAALLSDCLISALCLEHSSIWKLGAELSFSIRFFIKRNLSPVPGMQWTSFPTRIATASGKGQGLHLQQERCVCSLSPRSSALKKIAGYGRLAHTTDTELALSTLFFLWVKPCFYQCLCFAVSLATLNPQKMQWAKICGLLLWGFGIVRFFVVLMLEILTWDRWLDFPAAQNASQLKDWMLCPQDQEQVSDVSSHRFYPTLSWKFYPV